MKINQDGSTSDPASTNISSHTTTANQTAYSAEKVRWFLVRVAALLAILDLAVFLMTRNAEILLGSPLLIYPLIAIVNYYFPKRRE